LGIQGATGCLGTGTDSFAVGGDDGGNTDLFKTRAYVMRLWGELEGMA